MRLNDQLWARFDKGEISLEELEYIRFRDFAEALGLTNLNANQLNQQYIQALGRNSILLPGAEALCAALAPYCTQYIVTNGIKEDVYKRQVQYNTERKRKWHREKR